MTTRDNRAPDREWSDHDLERYHDGDLESLERAALGEALLESPALRERFGRVARIDAVARDALAAAAPRATRPALAAVTARRLLAAAACFAVVAAGSWIAVSAWSERAGPSTPAPDPGRIIAKSDAAARPDHAPGVRVVLSIPMPSPAPRPGDTLDSAVSRGDVAAATAAFTAADERTRDEFLRRQGEAIRSAARAEAFLDSLSAEDQLNACRVWAEDPRLRPAAFARLDRLRTHADLAQRYSAVMTHLSSRPELAAWVRSYIRDGETGRPALQSS